MPRLLDPVPGHHQRAWKRCANPLCLNRCASHHNPRYWNISAYNRGVMGYRTPNIDRIAAEGTIFNDYYGQQSCTAGRTAFITGQSPMRTGLLKVGLPGAKEGLSDKD